MKRAELDALLLLAGILPVSIHELANQYWPDCDAYAKVRRDHPWWLVVTKAGPVEIGWRKRVISINWSATQIRDIFTTDDVTKDDTLVHAWSNAKALEYLTKIATLLNTAPSKPLPQTPLT